MPAETRNIIFKVKLQNSERRLSFVMFVHLSAQNNLATDGWVMTKFDI
jgi:hypothetical protein